MKKVSIKDVAKEAGVSPTTVSYILNNNKNVSITPETRDRVLAAAEKLKYVLARSPRPWVRAGCWERHNLK